MSEPSVEEGCNTASRRLTAPALPRNGAQAVTNYGARHPAPRAYASFGAASGLGLPILGALLGHKTPATTARYAHLANDPLRAVADRIAGEIAAALDGRPLAEVLPLKAAVDAERK
jgi:integrase